MSAVLIGQSSMLAECAKLLLECGHHIVGVVSPAPQVRGWATGQGLPVTDFGPGLLDFLTAPLAGRHRPGRRPTRLHPAPGPDRPAASYEPKRLRLRILAVAGRLVHTARRRLLKIDPAWPWADTITTAYTRLCALPAS